MTTSSSLSFCINCSHSCHRGIDSRDAPPHRSLSVSFLTYLQRLFSPSLSPSIRPKLYRHSLSSFFFLSILTEIRGRLFGSRCGGGKEKARQERRWSQKTKHRMGGRIRKLAIKEQNRKPSSRRFRNARFTVWVLIWDRGKSFTYLIAGLISVMMTV